MCIQQLKISAVSVVKVQFRRFILKYELFLFFFFIRGKENVKLVKPMLTLEAWVQATDTVRTGFITNITHSDIVS